MRKSIYFILPCFFFCLPLAAQTSPAAEGPNISIWLGFSVSTFNSDYGCGSNSPFSCWNHQLIGISPYADTSAFLFGRIGAEGEARFMRWNGPNDMTMDSYLGGPRVRIWNHKKLLVSGKFLLGSARFNVATFGAGDYFAFAPGGSLDYRIARRVSTRLDYEYQIWPGFPDSG